MKKKLIALVLALVVALCVALPAMAATEEEIKGIKDKLVGIEALSADQLAAAFDWLNANGADLTTDQVAVASANIDAAVATVAGRNLADIPTAERNAIFGNISAAATAVGLSATLDGRTVSILNEDGEVIITEIAPAQTQAGGGVVPEAVAVVAAENPIRATGLTMDFTVLAIVGAALVAMFVLALVIGNVRKASSKA